MANDLTLTARWVFPGSSGPLENGVVTIENGVITAVSPKGVKTADENLGNIAIIPGLVNAHTHLDLSGLRGCFPPSSDFVGWLSNVIGHRRSATAIETDKAINAGLSESLDHGTTLLGDISGTGASWDYLVEAPVWANVYRELLGLSEERASAALATAQEWIQSRSSTSTCHLGISPHAPYSVRQTVFREVAKLRVPIAIHLAESREEIELIEKHEGAFVGFLKAVGVWDESGLIREIGELTRLDYGDSPVAFAHGNYLPPLSLSKRSVVVYCPRTHSSFGHDMHPFQEMLSGGITVAIGTDSLASNPDLDVLGELRFLRQNFPAVQGSMLLRMATLNGAIALGWDKVTGSLEAGKSADLVAVSLPNRDEEDPHELFLGPENCRKRHRKTMWRGMWR